MAAPLPIFDLAAGVVVSASVFGYVNQRFLGLVRTTALAIMGAAISLGALALDHVWPEQDLARSVVESLGQIDFSETLLGVLLSFMLFSGALQLDLQAMKRTSWHIVALTVSGVLVSTLIVGVLSWYAAGLTGLDLPLAWCLLFGSLISPTDPVAVLSTLKSTSVPRILQATVAGESLFNDGLAIVFFTVLLGVTSGTHEATFTGTVALVAREALGGAALGLALGWLSFRALRAIDQHDIEVLITLALVMGGYSIAQHLAVSGPVTMAIAGLIIGNHGRDMAMSETTRDHLTKFWSLVDEILNAVLFVLIGLEVIVVAADWNLVLPGLAAIPIALLARAVAVALPLVLLPRVLPRHAFPVLVLAGVRGGISIALALSIPESPHKHVVLVATYVVVAFSVLVQAPTVKRASGRLFERPARGSID